MSTLGYALLGLLAREPLSGYDVKRRMEERVGFFWSARHSQIYPELARLEREGMVTHKVVEQSDRPDKKVYEATSVGLKDLKEWVTAPVDPRPTRDDLVLKAYSLWLVDPEEALALFREQEQRHEEQLRQYEEIWAWMEREWKRDLEQLDSPRFASYAALRRGILYEREYAEWCSWVAKRLEKGLGGKSPDRSRRRQQASR
ncbi:MAG TPA: PadR family transcriptional regulator [Rubrobacteraceae bacterium]|nr:PadR family transcriptional regulator [Rubrobacteraceae bacterium]